MDLFVISAKRVILLWWSVDEKWRKYSVAVKHSYHDRVSDDLVS